MNFSFVGRAGTKLPLEFKRLATTFRGIPAQIQNLECLLRLRPEAKQKWLINPEYPQVIVRITTILGVFAG